MGGSSSDSDNEPGVSPGQVQAMTGSPVGTTSMGRDFSGMTPDEASKAMDVDQALSDAGYSSGYKGVSSKGGSVTNNGNPVSSGAYNNAKGQAEADYDYRMAEEKAKADFEGRMYDGPPVDPNLVNMAKGNLNTTRSFITNTPPEYMSNIGIEPYENPNLGPLGSSYTSFNNNPGYTMVDVPNNFIGPTRPSVISAAELLGSNLATGKSYAKGMEGYKDGTFADPYGSFLGSTVNETNRDLAATPGGLNNKGYLDQFQTGYNSTKDQGFLDGVFGISSPGDREQFAGKGDLNIDKAGNVGFQTGAQQFGDFMGEMLAGKVLGPLGMGLDFNTQTNYGTSVPGYSNTQQTTSFGIPDAIGGFLGSKAAPAIGNYVGGQVYGTTGNASTAMNSALASMAATQPMVSGATSQGLQALGVPADTVIGALSGSSISQDGTGIEVGEDAYNDFEERLGGGSGTTNTSDNNQGASLMNNQVPGLAAPLKILDTSGTYSDDAQGSAQTMFQEDQLKQYFANGSPSSLTGDAVMTAGNNPLFNANPAVTYRQSGGKNRDYGNAISNAVTPLQANNSLSNASRRRQFGDAMLGLFG
jgi:hypothetical protein